MLHKNLLFKTFFCGFLFSIPFIVSLVYNQNIHQLFKSFSIVLFSFVILITFIFNLLSVNWNDKEITHFKNLFQFFLSPYFLSTFLGLLFFKNTEYFQFSIYDTLFNLIIISSFFRTLSTLFVFFSSPLKSLTNLSNQIYSVFYTKFNKLCLK